MGSFGNLRMESEGMKLETIVTVFVTFIRYSPLICFVLFILGWYKIAILSASLSGLFHLWTKYSTEQLQSRLRNTNLLDKDIVAKLQSNELSTEEKEKILKKLFFDASIKFQMGKLPIGLKQEIVDDCIVIGLDGEVPT